MGHEDELKDMPFSYGERQASDVGYATIQGTITHETDKAIQFQMEDGAKEWYPNSQVKSIVRTNEIGQDKLTVKTWLLDKKNIEY